MSSNFERQNKTKTIFWCLYLKEIEKGVKGTEYQERVYNRTDRRTRETVVNKNATHKCPAIEEILIACGREVER